MDFRLTAELNPHLGDSGVPFRSKRMGSLLIRSLNFVSTCYTGYAKIDHRHTSSTVDVEYNRFFGLIWHNSLDKTGVRLDVVTIPRDKILHIRQL
uniref:Uncharacterized protein n=1 Tax=Babesia bovis TaxID=5865 RepID=S6C9K1_BABBO|nr:hypothetical protein [Babesia bovis]